MWVLRHYELSSLVDLVTSTGGNIYGLIFLFEWKVEHEMHPVQHLFLSSSAEEPLRESDIPC
jgi:hypothetical protein